MSSESTLRSSTGGTESSTKDQRVSAASLKATVEKTLCDTLRKKIKEKKVRIGDLARKMTPAISESQLRHLLKGGSPLSVDRFIQICRLLEFDPVQLLQGAQPEPRFSLAFTEEQEAFLIDDPWRFKLMKALSVPRTVEELGKVFPELPQLNDILNQLVEKKIALQDATSTPVRYRLNANEFQIASMRFSERYSDLLLKIIREMHEVTVDCSQNRRELVKYLRNIFVMDYFTPEQMMALREKAIEYSNEARRYIAKNRTDPKFAEISKSNLVGIVTMMAPISGKSFMTRN